MIRYVNKVFENRVTLGLKSPVIFLFLLCVYFWASDIQMVHAETAPNQMFEAENGTLSGSAVINNDTYASGGKKVGSMQVTGASITFDNVDGRDGGMTSLRIRYACNGDGIKSLFVNGSYIQKINFPSTGAWGGSSSAYKDVSVTVNLNAGINTIQIQRLAGDTNGTDFDRISVGGPKILHFSDDVDPNQLFTINGTDIHHDTVQVVVSSANGTVQQVPPANATSLNIVQTDENDRFVVARFDANLSSGVYYMWVGNAYGWSAPVKLNAARPMFISDYQAYEGAKIRLVGRNLDAKGFGASITNSLIRLKNASGTTYNMTNDSVNPFCIRFIVPTGVPLDTYTVEASNDTVNWESLNNGQTLEIVSAPSEDPAGLGVAWVKNFIWSRVYNVTDATFGAIPNDGIDDTAKIQKAINQIKTAGGGVVYLPEGTYDCSYLTVPAYVVLQGAGKDSTIIRYNGTGGSSFIRNTSDGRTIGRLGFSKFKIVLKEDNCPYSFINIDNADANATTDMTKRTISEIFISEVDIDTPTDHQSTGASAGFLVNAKERVIIQNCNLKGWGTTLYNYGNQYYMILNNVFEYAKGATLNTAQYAVIENNYLKGHPEHYVEEHGIMARGDCYVYNNTVENIGSRTLNDGEVVCAESPTGSFNFGTVSAATPSTLTVASVTTLATPTMRHGYLGVVIMDGRGMGQWRKVTSISGNTITVDKPWAVNPDSTSKWTLVIPSDQVTFYRNTGTNCGGGLLLYGNNLDSVAVENTLSSTGGVWAASFHVPSQYRLQPEYFIRMEGNIIDGIVAAGSLKGLGMVANTSTYAVESFGTEIRGNQILNFPSDASLFLKVSTTATYPNINNTIVENNTINNMTTGVTLTKGVWGTVFSGNVFNNVTTNITDGGSVNTVYCP